jgi:hypothetical protein
MTSLEGKRTGFLGYNNGALPAFISGRVVTCRSWNVPRNVFRSVLVLSSGHCSLRTLVDLMTVGSRRMY